MGRPPCERGWLANAFVAKAVLGLTTTAGLIERLTIDRALRRICGFPLCKKVPSESNGTYLSFLGCPFFMTIALARLRGLVSIG